MNTRRKFLMQSSMATTALLAASPFNSFAKIAAPVTGDITGSHSILFLHTAAASHSSAVQQINTAKNKYANVMLLHAGKATPQQLQQVRFDLSADDTAGENRISGNYAIIHKGDVKTGIIAIDSDAEDIVAVMNANAAYLKKEKQCRVVVCLSSLGYKNKRGLDDITLAKRSSNVDMIIGGHPDNFSSHTNIALNQDNEEVIIDHAAANENGLGKIAISFHPVTRQKHQIAF